MTEKWSSERIILREGLLSPVPFPLAAQKHIAPEKVDL